MKRKRGFDKQKFPGLTRPNVLTGINVIPDAILRYIIQFLDFQSRCMATGCSTVMRSACHEADSWPPVVNLPTHIPEKAAHNWMKYMPECGPWTLGIEGCRDIRSFPYFVPYWHKTTEIFASRSGIESTKNNPILLPPNLKVFICSGSNVSYIPSGPLSKLDVRNTAVYELSAKFPNLEALYMSLGFTNGGDFLTGVGPFLKLLHMRCSMEPIMDLKFLARFSSLEDLDLCASNISPASLAYLLQHLENLRSLAVTSNGIENVKLASKLMKKVYFYNCPELNVADFLLQCGKTLENLTIHCMVLPNPTLLSVFPRVYYLDIGHTNIPDNRIFSDLLSKFPNLKILELTGASLPPRLDFTKNPILERVIVGNGFNDYEILVGPGRNAEAFQYEFSISQR